MGKYILNYLKSLSGEIGASSRVGFFQCSQNRMLLGGKTLDLHICLAMGIRQYMFVKLQLYGKLKL